MHTEGKLMLRECGMGFEICNESGEDLTEFLNGAFKSEDARRLVACWNACDGMPLLHLERLGEEKKGVMQLVAHREELRQQRDELVKAAEEAIKILESHQEERIANELRAALDKAKCPAPAPK